MTKIGEYVRTINNGIKKIDTIFENRTVNRYGYEIGSEWDGKEYAIIKTTEILNHSKNLIDLIEVGDYVNGEKVIEVQKNGVFAGFENDWTSKMWLPTLEIKSIVTKEQFAKMKYKVV